MIEMVEAACAVPTTMQGRILEDVARNVDCRDDPPAGRRLRGDRPVQLPGDGAVLVPAVRDRLRQHVRPEALRAGAADPADRLRGARRRSACRPASSTSSTAAARSSRGSSTTRASTPSRSSARRRSRKLVYERAAQAGKRVQALGGAKNHMVVMPDAVIDKTVDGHHRLGLRRGRPALHGGLGRRDRRRGARAPDAARSSRRREALRVGDGLDERIDVGPVVSVRGARPHRGWIERGVADGADARRRRPRAPSAGRRRRVRRPDDPRRRRRRTWRSRRRRSSARCSS